MPFRQTTGYKPAGAGAIDHGWKSRLLTCKRIFNADNTLVAEDSIFYTTELLHTVPNFKAFELTEYDYMYTRYYNVGGLTKVTKEVNRQYVLEQEVIRTVKEYTYDSPHHKKITQIKTSISRGDTITEKYYYPTEYENYFSSLNEKNILNPVDVRSYRNGKLTSGMQIQYNDAGLPMVRYKYESGDNDIAFNKSNPFTFIPYMWNSYDFSNLLQSQKTKDGVYTTYLWSYNGQYPIVEIKNATYYEVINAMFPLPFFRGSPDIDGYMNNLTSSDEPDAENWLKINSLRKQLPKALVTTYTYKPLVGMVSQTDPRGVTTYYGYDAFGRLKETYIIEDGEKKILQAYDYHYTDNQ